MEIDLDAMRRITRLAGFEWTDAELLAIRPALGRTLELLARLESLPLRDVEPTTQYHVI